MRIGFGIHQANTARVVSEKFFDAVPERIRKDRIQSLVIHFMNLHRPDMARKCTRGKAVATAQGEQGKQREKEEFQTIHVSKDKF